MDVAVRVVHGCVGGVHFPLPVSALCDAMFSVCKVVYDRGSQEGGKCRCNVCLVRCGPVSGSALDLFDACF